MAVDCLWKKVFRNQKFTDRFSYATLDFLLLKLLISMNARHFLSQKFFPLSCLVFSSCSDPEITSGDPGNPDLATKIELGAISSTELSPASKGAEGGLLFERLSPAGTGVDYTNTIVDDHPMRYLYATEKVCGGVAAGDVDGNGLPDLFFTNGPAGNGLFLQTAPLKFSNHTSAAGLNRGEVWSAGSTMIDIDGDGDLDIYVANYGSANQLFVNRGDATFEEKAKEFGLAHVSASHMPTFCDYDKDGDLDLYLLTNRFHSPQGQPKSEEVLRFEVVNGAGRIKYTDPQLGLYFRPYQAGKAADGRPIFKIQKVGQADVLFRNDGGKFVDVSKQAGIYGAGFGLSATWWDYNSDGWIDLWVGNDFDDPDRVYRNNGDGTFTDVVKKIVPHTSWFSMGADFADLNGDQKPDFLIADMSGTNHFKQKTNMGSMGAKAEFLRTANPQQYMRNALFLGTGGERLMQGAQMAGLANSDWTWTVKLSDFDCDGLPDVFMTNGMSKNFNESDNAAVLAKAGETEWDRHVRAGTEELREQNLAFKNEGDLKFTNMSRAWGLNHVGMSFGAAHADLDRDGDLDLVVCNLGEPVSIYRNNTIGGNRLVISLKGAGANKFGVGSKLTLLMDDDSVQQRQLIPVRGYLASNEPLVHFGLGERQPKSLTIEWADGHRQEVGNLKANHYYSISQSKESLPAGPSERDLEPMFVKSKTLEGAGHRENEFDDFIRQPLLPNKMSRLGPGQAWGDLDGDGDDDLWLGGAVGSAGQVWINGGAGSFAKKNFQALANDSGFEDMGGLWFDADGNGTTDLYVVSGGSDFEPGDPELKDRLYLNSGGELGAAPDGTLPDVRASGGVVVGADFDRDGDVDLFVGGRQIPGAYPEAAQSSLLVNDGGKFSDAGLDVKGLVTSALWSDANGDGWLDLLVTSEWGPVRVFQNKGGKLSETTESTGTADLTGWWNGIAGGDFDGDGDIDYAVTNFGLNTKYHASEGHPALIYFGDFENLGRKRIVEAEFEDDVLYPGRGRSCSSNAMPHLRKSFTSFKQFAGAALTDIYQPDRLKNALKLNATTFESGVLMNNSEAGRTIQFTFQPLPRIAQIAPSFGVVVDDVNHDGKVDLYLAQNFHSPQVETGRMSGGLSQLLFGSGDGNFEPISAEQSGLWVPGDAASLTRVDVNEDGAVDFVVGKNDAPLEVFEKRGGGAKTIQVKLKGGVGNLSAVGARISLKMQSGRVLSQEIYAGGGYLSQSPSGVYFAVPEEGQGETLEVVWPNGAKSSHQVDRAARSFVISQPN